MEEAQFSAASLAFMIGGLIFLSFVVRQFLARFSVPALVGYIGLGMGMSIVDRRWAVLDATGQSVFDVLGSIGIVALLFRVGVESDLSALRRKLGQSTPIWLGSVAVAGAAGFAAAYYVLALDWLPSLFVGAASTATSVGVSVSVWSDAGAMQTENGERLLDVAEMDDISGVALLSLLLAVAPILNGSGRLSLGTAIGETAALFFLKFVGFALLCVLLSRFAERPVTAFWQRRLSRVDLTILIAAVGIMIAAAAEWLGLSMAIGALFAGFVFSRDRDSVRESNAYQAFLDLFAPFFFIVIGLNFDPGVASQALSLAVPLFVAAVLGKFLGTALPALLAAGTTGAVLIGISMVPRAEIAMIIMERGRQQGYVPDTVFGAMLLVSLATSTVAPIVLQRLLQRWPQRT